ncbi:OTU domain [Dillenia turbinata]|uniref:Ubiquitin thioesterase OTU n=1 Tax=Dillenia turbinata TaxID=194707 RepID=A0AAN8ZRJ6_9MAGN
MGERPSNKSVLEQLKNGIARFELIAPPARQLASFYNMLTTMRISATAFWVCVSELIGWPCLCTKQARKKLRLGMPVKGMAFNKGIALNPREEREDADDLRMAVREILCENGNERDQYEEALISITVDESLKCYCERIRRPDFWGGESELLVLSKLCRQPVIVYIPEHEHSTRGWGSGFIPIAEYGAEFQKASRKGKCRKVVWLLYSGRNHYDLLV